MEKSKQVDKNIGLQIVGVLVFIIAFGLLFLFPFGTIFGIILMIASGRLGYKKLKGWKCASCGYFFEAKY
ncbi:hypothetical protein HOE22_05970 [Candidatus Woesearchaeota archaeon]|jgi:hypothetical protein|nr:hypothetical protein [Candidatus Woesearchaeota archaeon]MBT5528491.1 hypothetical protein [Cytophagia bacterium]MBT5991932.1 hypothetical protein [Bacteroidota bacterium]